MIIRAEFSQICGNIKEGVAVSSKNIFSDFGRRVVICFFHLFFFSFRILAARGIKKKTGAQGSRNKI